jgi:hypothetical protein
MKVNLILFIQTLGGKVSWGNFFWFLRFDHRQKKYLRKDNDGSAGSIGGGK